MFGSENGDTKTIRLDRFLVEHRYFSSREKAAFAMRAGGVRVNGREVTKPATPVAAAAAIAVDSRNTLRIGRGERKLAGVLQHFAIDCAGKVALDVGSSIGGFTWQLLQQGATRVYAVDVGSDQLHETLRADPRVSVYEQTDVRNLAALPEQPHIAAVDVSFISLRAVLPHVRRLIRADGEIAVLLKPQFEVATIGLKKSKAIHGLETQRRVSDAFTAWCNTNGLKPIGEIASPLSGKHGAREVFFHLVPVEASNRHSHLWKESKAVR